MSLKWKPKPATSSAQPRLGGSPHAHACLQCGERYEDACETSAEDDICASCRHGHPWPFWRTSRLPQTCCRSNSRKATKDDRSTYRLGGQATWWICLTCKRTHPYDPKEPRR